MVTGFRRYWETAEDFNSDTVSAILRSRMERTRKRLLRSWGALADSLEIART
jgi:hypothetical protein